MLRRDPSARFEQSGAWILARHHFVSGELRSERSWSAAEVKALRARQQETPVAVLTDAERGCTWWMFEEEVYWEDEGYSEFEMKALILERRGKSERRVQRAVALMEQADVIETSGRERIPDEVRVFVWNRDGGRCVNCGSKERLEFDHVIPLALGGANTARNLQVLCEACNRSKGAALA